MALFRKRAQPIDLDDVTVEKVDRGWRLHSRRAIGEASAFLLADDVKSWPFEIEADFRSDICGILMASPQAAAVFYEQIEGTTVVVR